MRRSGLAARSGTPVPSLTPGEQAATDGQREGYSFRFPWQSPGRYGVSSPGTKAGATLQKV